VIQLKLEYMYDPDVKSWDLAVPPSILSAVPRPGRLHMMRRSRRLQLPSTTRTARLQSSPEWR